METTKELANKVIGIIRQGVVLTSIPPITPEDQVHRAIERYTAELQAENTRLREALEYFANINGITVTQYEGTGTTPLVTEVRHVQSMAKAALNSKEGA